jgi:hypothetical protein
MIDFDTTKCFIMESKKKPIWSTGINTTPNGEPVQFLFKDGDDIRQD